MRTLVFTTLLAASLAGCAKEAKTGTETEASSQVPTVSIDQLDQLLAKQTGQAVDANGEGTRKKLGIIPGAVLLTDSETFLPSELPADKQKPLVFYCANTRCGASHEAAAKALTAGYTNVKVLPDGIAGWIKAGKQTSKI
ncbi:MAG: rhodanese-like domain-containing protein [Deltaproteobacteria bacterium]|nr:rhodanese-like domain-containing protein [Deltaproteobacteria bacterium]MDQ3299580.1 rhodanese-like domain-containing protein [Myxococcota bacterium]